MDGVTELPHTAEGDLLRERRELAGLSVEQACAGTPLKRSKWGDVERGRSRAARGNPPREWHAPAPVVAIMAMRLKVAPADIAETGREDAAAIVERETASPSASVHAPASMDDLMSAADDMFFAFAESRPDKRVLFGMWYRSFDAEGRLKPLDERMRQVAAWLGRPRGGEAETAEGTG